MNSVVNFRDIGGFPTQQGTVVKTGHFFRSVTRQCCTSGSTETGRGLSN